MTQSDFELLAEADWYFRKMVRKFVKERDRITIDGITLPGMFILHKIIEDGEQRLGDLAEELDFTSGAITAVSDKLEKRQLAIRRRLPEDRRTVLLTVTEQGRTFYERHRNIGAACTTLLFGEHSQEELQQQITRYREMTERLNGFSQAILELAAANGQQDEVDTQVAEVASMSASVAQTGSTQAASSHPTGKDTAGTGNYTATPDQQQPDAADQTTPPSHEATTQQDQSHTPDKRKTPKTKPRFLSY
ncbi:MarR family winged helix-turn-helix transcriptional regulator [Paenibacillus sp. WLX1005]|uniref:MarR family winged helix-turn-helix transcriptional regulator n=1 Tax=Paenibacillus sp. WLX1005 TaxID=3243766 RepID=UPI00398450C8